MAGPATTTFLTLPPELRERVYEYIALSHNIRRVHIVRGCSESIEACKISTSAIAATCRLIHNEYQDTARKNTTGLGFTAVDVNFDDVMTYFRIHVDYKYLSVLQQNKAKLYVNIVIPDRTYRSFKPDLQAFCTWALFLIDMKLEAVYGGEPNTWMSIHETLQPDFAEGCMKEIHSSEAICENIQEIRRIAEAFDGARWRAYPKFQKELQVRRHAEWDRREAEAERWGEG